MKLRYPENSYSVEDQRQMRSQIELSDQLNHKRNQDVEVGKGRLILLSPNGTRYSITVSNAGAITAVAI